MTPNTRNINDLSNATAFDSDNDKLGSVKEVYINDTTGQPDFVEVGHGLFGMSSSLVPLRGHRLNGDELQLAFPKDRIKDAPNLDADEHLDPTQLETLYHHYGLESTENTETYTDPSDHRAAEDRSAAPGTAGTAGLAGAAGARETTGRYPQATDAAGEPDPVADPSAYADDSRMDHAAGHATDAPGPNVRAGDVGQTPRGRNPVGDTDEGGELTRSEEQLRVSKDRETTGKVRLRKHIVHDTETVDVPVEREEVHVERTPVDPNEVTDRDRDLVEDEASVTLHEERVNVDKESVPVEKVRLDKDTVRDTERVTEDVAREEIEAEGLNDRTDRPGRKDR
ncbi:DUF2382 domain-containing protein [Corynebacterium halotolerans]|uniref:DUF2382 domain-containing protein n=1 Tax=Corynebacterium halotolerans TaxID=225326 RepID=UPI003CEBBCCA